MMNIGIIGCGWLGTHLAAYFHPANNIFVTTRSPSTRQLFESNGFNVTLVDFSDLELSGGWQVWDCLSGLDVIIITIPFSKDAAGRDQLNRFANISRFISLYHKQLFLMSSIGIYPQLDMEMEESTLAPNRLHPGLLGVENALREKFPQLNILRLGGLMGMDRVFSNYKVRFDQQFVNHVHYRDICAIIGRMILKKCSRKTYNVVAPVHPTKAEVFTCQRGYSPGSSLQEIGHGRKVLSNLLVKELGYEFKHPDPGKF